MMLLLVLVLLILTSSSSSNNSIVLKDGGSDSITPSDEQTALNAIISALKRLPSTELERLGLDINAEYVANTPSGAALREAWRRRQAELKTAMSSIVKPAEAMANLTTRMMDNATGVEEKVSALLELESLLIDVDNARDYHTIGGWPSLVALLALNQPVSVRTIAAWAVGTAVKNDYDYQLWTIENVTDPISTTTTTTCIELLAAALSSADYNEGNEELQKKALYALSSASRGNVDVQGKLLDLDDSVLENLLAIVVREEVSVELIRKVWSFIGDMLEERRYVKVEMVSEQRLEDVLSGPEMEMVQKMKLLGDLIMQNSTIWLHAALDVLEAYLQVYIPSFLYPLHSLHPLHPL